MNPHYEKSLSQPEKDFIKLLEDPKNKVIWWYRNGEREQKYFAVLRYEKDGSPHGFYVDFLVMTDDGRVGLFDPKSGFTAKGDEGKSRAEALTKYIQEQNHKNKKKLWGGIVQFKDGICRYNDNLKYNENINKDWKFLSFK